jgi:UPF0716 protein FxsA
MLAKLFLIFILVPILEMALLIRLGQLLGFWPTIALVVATGAIGALLAKSQGLRVLSAIQADLATGQPPASRLVDGLLILLGGVLLLTPGLITDTAGFLLLLPFTRSRMKESLRRRFEKMVRSGQVSMIGLIR